MLKSRAGGAGAPDPMCEREAVLAAQGWRRLAVRAVVRVADARSPGERTSRCERASIPTSEQLRERAELAARSVDVRGAMRRAVPRSRPHPQRCRGVGHLLSERLTPLGSGPWLVEQRLEN
jgi:hypothetical protein